MHFSGKGGIIAALMVAMAWPCKAQSPPAFKTWNPALDSISAIEGRIPVALFKDPYDRLPAKAESKLRKEVWQLSKNGAGLMLRFNTNAPEIIIKYTVSGSRQMPHMPATGVSGVDLYAKSIDGQWQWAAGKYAFGDTISYRFSNLSPNDQHVKDREYHLYLPLYNSVTWLEMTVPAVCLLQPLPVRRDKPVVVYGTSIAQGGCASRPGLAWPAILGRKLERPVVNLGFSGNGRLEPELTALMAEADARLYVLDCLPNMMSAALKGQELKNRLTAAILFLRTQRPKVPVLLTDHAGYTDEALNAVHLQEYQDANRSLGEVFDSLKTAGITGIYRLTKEDIGQDIESMVDGVHPNDIGMMRYAEAYEKRIREILQETAGTSTTTRPVTQRRNASTYDWETRHEELIKYNQQHKPEWLLIGNSITHNWGGEPVAPRRNGGDTWHQYFGGKKAVNMGFGWDRIENVLWRVHHGELDGFRARQMVLMIGTNNMDYNTDEEIVEGLQFLTEAIQLRQPDARLLLMGILPRRGMEGRIARLNLRIASIAAKSLNITYGDAGPAFLQQDKKINEALFSDGLHPNVAGYDKLGDFISRHCGIQ